MSISEVIQDAKSYYNIVTQQRSNSSSQLSHLKNCLCQQRFFYDRPSNLPTVPDIQHLQFSITL